MLLPVPVSHRRGLFLFPAIGPFHTRSLNSMSLWLIGYRITRGLPSTGLIAAIIHPGGGGRRNWREIFAGSPVVSGWPDLFVRGWRGGKRSEIRCVRPGLASRPAD